MFELDIKNTKYSFRFGFGFVRDISKKEHIKLENGEKQEFGLQMAVAGLMDKDPVALIDILELANKTEKPNVTRKVLDEYFEDEEVDIDSICDDVLGFLKNGNATRTKTLKAIEGFEKLLEEQKNEKSE